MPHTLLFVDDEENILKALRRLFRRTGHEILTARSGEEAVEFLRTRPVSLVISDHRMPGMTGAELLTATREIQPDAVRIMLTGYADVRAAMQAINDGQVYRFLSKPWEDAAVLRVVEEGLADLDLKQEYAELQERVRRQNEELKELNESLERKVLERTNELEMSLTFWEELSQSLRQQNLAAVKAFAGLLDLRDQAVGAHCRRIAALVPTMCKKLGPEIHEKTQSVVIAALLHDIGKIALPDAVLLKDPSHLGSAEREEFVRHPVLGQGQLQVLEGFADVGQLIRHHHENWDGTGYPDGLAAEAIPLGARILRVLDAHDHLTRGGMRKGAEERMALEAMDRQVGSHFDPLVFNALLDVLEERKDQYDASKEMRVPLDELREGQVLTRDLQTHSGILLVAKDEILKPSYLEKIRSFTALYSTEPYAYVYRK